MSALTDALETSEFDRTPDQSTIVSLYEALDENLSIIAEYACDESLHKALIALGLDPAKFGFVTVNPTLD